MKTEANSGRTVQQRSFETPARRAQARRSLFPRHGVRTILVPVEVDERGRTLIEAAAAWSEQLDARLIFLHVSPPVSFLPPLATVEQFAEWSAAVKNAASEKFARLKADFEEDPFIRSAGFLVVEGDLVPETLKIARDIQADLILLTTHAYRGWRHFLHGSKAEAILHSAPCAVLLIPLAEIEPGAADDLPLPKDGVLRHRVAGSPHDSP